MGDEAGPADVIEPFDVAESATEEPQDEKAGGHEEKERKNVPREKDARSKLAHHAKTQAVDHAYQAVWKIKINCKEVELI